MSERSIAAFHYRIPWRAPGIRPGAHLSRREGTGQLFRGHAPLLHHPDPRHLDLRASSLDPFGGFWVRVYDQRSSIKVYLIADLSASMGFCGRHPKMAVLAQFAAALAFSAERTGDAFGFIGCDDAVRRDFLLPAGYRRGAAESLLRRLAAHEPREVSARGLRDCGKFLPGGRALVFLVSDFHLPEREIETALRSLSRHDVVPVVLWDPAEAEALPEWGLMRLRDPERGGRRTLMLRPRLKRRIALEFRERKRRLTHLFLTHGREPLFLTDGFDAGRVTEYFYRSG